MLFFALLTFLAGFTLFNVGGSMPGSGLGDVQQVAPPKVAPTGRATLTLKRTYPMVIVAGSRFKPGETVRVTGTRTMRVRASTGGTFVVRFRSSDPCNSLTFVAVGSRGSRASIQYSQVHCAVP